MVRYLVSNHLRSSYCVSALCGTRTAVVQRTNPGPLESQLVWVGLGSPIRGLASGYHV